MLHAVNSQFNTVVVSSRDTDVLLLFDCTLNIYILILILILLVSHFQCMQCEHLWIMSGTSRKRRYIPIDDVFNKLPRGSATSLLAFHALTGHDTTSYIANHTKHHHGRSSKSIMNY